MYAALGRTIHVLRTDQGLDRKALAERAGISYSYLAAIENGKKPPSSKVLFAIANALGLRSHELLASAETRIEHGANLAASPAERGRSRWFHGKPEGLTPADAPAPQIQSDAAMPDPAAPEPRASLRETPDYRFSRSIPRSPSGYLLELRELTRDLSDEDREMVLDLARRLAGRSR
jgi:transcriptional regulator with XRE-family HTH domain